MGRSEGSFSKPAANLIILVFTLSLLLFPLWGWSYAETGGQFISSKICATCHKEIYRYWEKSLHRRAVEDPVFYAAYLEAYKITEGKAKYICTRCHAPTVQLTEDYAMNSDLSKEGVTCDYCHSIKSLDLSSEEFPFTLDVGNIKRGPRKIVGVTLAPHESEYSRLHTTSELCAGCHEYKNPNGVLVLSTYSEWKNSKYAKEGRQCQSCHMPVVPVEGLGAGSEENGGNYQINRHDVSGGHSIPMLKRAVEVRIVKVNDTGKKLLVEVEVENVGSGHKVPTGIPSRRLVLNVSVKTDGGLILTGKRIYRKVVLDKEGQEITRDSMILIEPAYIASDNRLGPGETRKENFTFFLPRGKPVEVKAFVSYLYKPLVLEEGRMEVEMSSATTRIPR